LASKSGTSPSLKQFTTHCPSDTHSLAVTVTDTSLLTGVDSDSEFTGLARCGDAAAGLGDAGGDGDCFSLTDTLANTFSALWK